MDPDRGASLSLYSLDVTRVRSCRFYSALLAATGILSVFALPLRADDIPLRCGVPVVGQLERGDDQEFVLRGMNGATVVVDAVDITGSIDLLRLKGKRESTCSGSLRLSLPYRDDDQNEIEVSDCIGQDRGSYLITASVVSQGPANCSTLLPCGVTPTVQRFRSFGETRPYWFWGRAGDEVRMWAGKGRPRDGEPRMRLRLFDPMGRPVMAGDTCGGRLATRLPVDGMYTLLVSVCGRPEGGLYWLAFDGPACPAGPEVSYLGVARADGRPLQLGDFDEQGRPVFQLSSGSGILLVFEGTTGRDRSPVGSRAFVPQGGGSFGWPDLQVIVSQPLGNGSAAVCDKQRPQAGGVPGVPSLSFDDTPAVRNAINDLGCRFDDGTGEPRGVPEEFACTFFPDGEFHFVRPESTIQFCALVTSAWAFRPGRTIVKARLLDELGRAGPPREMVIEVEGPVTTLCPGDCNQDGGVTVDEIVLAVRAALGEADLALCPAVDTSGDGEVTIDEILAAVMAALAGCS